MKFSSLSLMLFVSVSFTSLANEVDKMVEFSVSQMISMGEFKALAEFTGIEASRLEDGFRTALTICLNHDNFEDGNLQEDGDLLEACMRREIPVSSGLSSEQMDAWDEREDEMSPSEQLDEKIEIVHEKIFQLEDKVELTASEEKELLKLENKLIQLHDKQSDIHMQELENMKKMLSDLNTHSKQ